MFLIWSCIKFVEQVDLLQNNRMHFFGRHLAVHKVVLINAVRINQVNDNRVVQKILAFVAFWTDARICEKRAFFGKNLK